MSAPEVPTAARIRAALAARGVRPRRRFGQNFLTDRALLERIVDAAELAPGAAVLEVGSGPGTLTAVLLGRGAHVLAVEVDPTMVDLLAELLGRPADLTVLQADVLAERPVPGPRLAAALDRVESGASRPGYALVANLPYQVAATLLPDLLWNRPFRRAVVTVQEEVAERLRARPGTREYGPLGVLVQLRARVERVRRLGRAAFWPAPNVDSACVRLDPIEIAGLAGLDPAFLAEVVHGVFHARRKSLLNSLALAFAGRFERALLSRRLDRENFEKEQRGESLAPMEIVRLARVLAGAPEAGQGCITDSLPEA